MEFLPEFARRLELHGAGKSLDSLSWLADRVLGRKLFTCSVFELETGKSIRIYSNMPTAYPVSGLKDIVANIWTKRVLDNHETFVANDAIGLAEVFADYKLIGSLGCESVINIPVVLGGKFFGTVNCLHEAGYYTPERVAASEKLKLPALACFLISRISDIERGSPNISE